MRIKISTHTKCSIHRKKFICAFTLIELLIVISIISLLASVILASLSVARQDAYVAKLESELNSLQIAMEEYYSNNGYYPGENYSISGGGYTYSIQTVSNGSQQVYYPGSGPGGVWDQTTSPTAQQILTNALVPKYISGLPQEILQGTVLHYSVGAGLNGNSSEYGYIGLMYCGNLNSNAQNYMIYFDYNPSGGNATYLKQLSVNVPTGLPINGGYALNATSYYCLGN